MISKLNQSIKTRLLMYLLLSLFVTGVPAFGLSFYFTYQELEEFQDSTLEQVAKLYINNNLAKQHYQKHEDYQLSVFSLNSKDLPSWLPATLTNGFHTLNDNDDETLRIWVGQNKQHQKIAVVQPTSERNELALDSALQVLIPLIVMFPLTGILIWFIFGNALKSIKILAEQVDGLVDEVPKSLPNQDVPNELQGFIYAINRLLTRLHSLFVRQQRFSADAAHELRTPLSALSLQVQNLEQASTLEEMKKRLQPLKLGIERSQRLTEQLLDMNRSQVQQYQKTPLSLNGILLELLSLYWPKAEQKSMQLILEGQDIKLNTHPEALLLILGNALDNAINYAPENTDIIIRVINQTQHVLLEIENQTEGRQKLSAEKVFEPFVRATETNVVGNGLGLSIAKAAAEQLQAQIALKNKSQNSGVVFSLRHPK